MKHIVLLLAIIIYSEGLFAQKLSVKEAKEDFGIFETALTEAHPGIYRYESKATFDSLFLQTEKQLNDSLSQQEFYRILSPLVADLHCGHTKFHPEGIYDEDHLYHYYYGTENLFPLKLYFTDEKAFYTDSYDLKMNFEKGTEIIAINDRPIDELITFFFSNIVADGRVVSSKYLELNNYFSAYYANLIEASNEFHLTLKDKNGDIFRETVSATSLVKIQEYEKRNDSESEATFSLTFPKEQVALMRIKAFYPLRKEDDFKSFLKNAFEEIHVNETKKLIIDLRDNEGGNDRWGSLLFSYLTDQPFSYYEALKIPNKNYSFKEYAQLPKFYGLLKLLMIRKDDTGGYKWTKHKNLGIQQPQKHPFLGEVVVLINGFSFSVTSEFAAVAKGSGRVQFVGQETGGAYGGNNSGTFVIVTLPHSRLTLGIPMVGYYMAVPPVQPFDCGVLPDIEITPTIQQIIANEDIALKWVLEKN